MKIPPVLELGICVAGIYASFLTWAVLQERISTTPYGDDKRVFRASLVINTVQSVFASVVGFIYLRFAQKSAAKPQLTVFRSFKDIQTYLIIALAQSLSSPFAYASLQYVDYVTLLLAKSCKLVPVMALHILLYRRSFPFYKYAVVVLITIGVSLFTMLHNKPGKSSSTESSMYGIGLLLVNLFLDGFYNSAQDDAMHRDRSITGPHMMAGLNAMSSALTIVFLLTPFTDQLREAIDFIAVHPRVLQDIVLFAICGALGQIFIFHTLARYGSIVLVTVTVTRKMFSMLLSVIWFNHRLSGGQWAGISLVFVGICYEAYVKYQEKRSKAQDRKDE